MSEKEKPSQPLPAVKWAAVYRGLRPFLRPFGDSGEGRLDFYHRSLSKAVRRKYFNQDSEDSDSAGSGSYWWHKKLADYFQNVTNIERKVEVGISSTFSLSCLSAVSFLSFPCLCWLSCLFCLFSVSLLSLCCLFVVSLLSLCCLSPVSLLSLLSLSVVSLLSFCLVFLSCLSPASLSFSWSLSWFWSVKYHSKESPCMWHHSSSLG